MDEYISREAALNLIEHNDKVCHYADERYENVVYATTQTICKVVAEMPAAAVQLINQWISVNDRLPEKEQKVLVFYKAIGEKNRIHNDVIATNWRKSNGDFIPVRDYEITHWMPLPEPPKDGDADA